MKTALISLTLFFLCNYNYIRIHLFDLVCSSAARRGNLTLSSVLVFATSTDEEPVLGFKTEPCILFCEVISSFLPTANTCTNTLVLPRPTQEIKLPKREELFKLYDYAFSNAFYGVV